MGSGLLATFRCVCRVSCGCGVKAVGCSYGYVTRGVELVPCDATEEWQRLVVVRDCSDLSSSRRLDHFASSALPAPSSEPPGPPRGPPAPDPPRPSASVRSSVTRPARAFAMLMRLCRPTPARSVATRELRPTVVLPPASLHVGSFTLQLYTHRHRDRRHTRTRSPKRHATRIGRRSHRDHTASYSHRVLFTVGAAPGRLPP